MQELAKERQHTALYLKQLANEIQGFRSQQDMDFNLRRNGMTASMIAALVNQSELKQGDMDKNDIEQENSAYIEETSIPETETALDEIIQSDLAKGEDSSLSPKTDVEPKKTTVEMEKVRKSKKGDARTQLVEWMLQESFSDDEAKWYIYRVMKNTLPLADILYEMPETINVGRAAMIKLFSAIRSGDYDELLKTAVVSGLDQSRVFVKSRAAINEDPPAAKRGRKAKE